MSGVSNGQMSACQCSSPECARWGCQANRQAPYPTTVTHQWAHSQFGPSEEARAMNNLADAMRELAAVLKEKTP